MRLVNVSPEEKKTRQTSIVFDISKSVDSRGAFGEFPFKTLWLPTTPNVNFVAWYKWFCFKIIKMSIYQPSIESNKKSTMEIIHDKK